MTGNIGTMARRLLRVLGRELAGKIPPGALEIRAGRLR
jgi:hypothetical protein